MNRFQKPLRAWPSSLNLFLVLLAGLLALEMFLIKGNMGLSLVDEGFLWYGAIHTFLEEVPLRDFYSYAPGRYYWCAAWFHLGGPGILSLRFSESLFQWMGLAFGLLAAKRLTDNRWELFGIGLLLTLWMYPDYKYFDCAIPLIALYLGFRLLEDPAPVTCWSCGFFAGFSSFIGWNHGLYQAFSFGILFLVLGFSKGEWLKETAWGLAGFICGGVPYLGMALRVQGFERAFAAEAARIWGQGTNIGLPVPWPWTTPLFREPSLDNLSLFMIGGLFLLTPLAYLFWFVKYFPWSKKLAMEKKYLWVGAVVGIPYLHYAFSRADFEHLAIALPPLWLGFRAMAPLFRGKSWPVLVLSLLCSFLSVGERSHLGEWLGFSGPRLVEYPVAGDMMHLDLATAGQLEGLKPIVQSLAPDESILFFPYHPTFYCVFGKKSPVWEIFSTLPATPLEQQHLMEQMEKSKVPWCVIDNAGIDGRDDLEFQNTHPLFLRYLQSRYRLMAPSLFHLPPNYLLFYKLQGPGSVPPPSNKGVRPIDCTLEPFGQIAGPAPTAFWRLSKDAPPPQN